MLLELELPNGHRGRFTRSELLAIAAECLALVKDAEPIEPPPRSRGPVERLRWFLDSEEAVGLTAAQRTCLEAVLADGGESTVFDLGGRVWRLQPGQNAPKSCAVAGLRARTNRQLAPHGLRLFIGGNGAVRILAD